jgi:hypothetical protein
MRESTGHIDTVAANAEIEAAAVTMKVRVRAMTAMILLPIGGTRAYGLAGRVAFCA